jgi:hypothetical protein
MNKTMKHRQLLLTSFFILFVTLYFAIPELGLTQSFTYQTLSGITDPQGNPLLEATTTLPFTLTRLYQFGIGLAFTLGFLSFLYAGWEYIGSDLITKKEDGRKRMKNAAIGIIIALTGYVLLNTINPDILAFQSLDLNIEKPTSSNFLERLFKDPLRQTNESIANDFTGKISIQNNKLVLTTVPKNIPGLRTGDIVKSVNLYPINTSNPETARISLEAALDDCPNLTPLGQIGKETPREITKTFLDIQGNTICASEILVQRGNKEVKVQVETQIAKPVSLSEFFTAVKYKTGTDRGYNGSLGQLPESDVLYITQVGALTQVGEYVGPSTKITNTGFTQEVTNYVKNCPERWINEKNNYCLVPFVVLNKNNLTLYTQEEIFIPILIN